MSKDRPPPIRFESWVDKRIREAAERGEFENLPGAGKPLRGLGRPYDEMWWVKQKLRDENLSYLPPSLALRKEVHDTLDAAMEAKTEQQARDMVTRLNETIVDALRNGLRGPPVMVTPVKVERFVRDWRRRHGGSDPG
jgi:DnaJ homologue, subfamily C, member 28, conserved domain